MKTNTAHVISTFHRASLFTRLWLACLLLLSVLMEARAANTFDNTDDLDAARSAHTATLLPNGKVLVAGGFDFGVALGSAELYDPGTGFWSPASPLGSPRSQHTATLLPSGKVLLAGGNNGGVRLNSAQLYDPATGNWTAAGAFTTARSLHTATLLPNGKVLIVGGTDGSSPLASAELYDPATDSWSAAGNLATARETHSATLLADGRVLVAGGFNGVVALGSVELYNPATNVWTTANPLANIRSQHSATLLPNGKVLVAGGLAGGGVHQAISELYDPATGSWSPTLGPLNAARRFHSATLLPNGKVLVTGGLTFSGAYLASAEIFDPNADTWSTTTSDLGTPRSGQTATLLPGGQLLIAGGITTGSVRLKIAQLFDSAIGAWSAATPMLTARTKHTATLLPNGKVLVAGGFNSGGYLASAELYDPATGLWSAAGTFPAARAFHTATLLPNGKVLVAGGYNGTYLASAALYDPATETWSGTGPLAAGRSSSTATLLPSGKVLVVGGEYSDSDGNILFFSSAELFDPATGTWSGAGSLAIERASHTATLLPSGKVLVAGGMGRPNYNGFLSSEIGPHIATELFDPATGSSTREGNIFPGRSRHTATLLPSGNVLVAGGRDANDHHVLIAQLYNPATRAWGSAIPSVAPDLGHTASLLPDGKVLLVSNGGAQLFDPATGFPAASAGSAVRTDHTATLLPDGRVLIAGGRSRIEGSSLYTYLASAEFYDAGLGFSAAWQPQISSASFDATGRLVLTGTGFRGISSASGGNGSQDSPTNYPLVQLRRLGNEQTAFLSPDPGTAVSATGFTSAPVAPYSDRAQVTVFVNGIPSAAVFPTGSVLSLLRDTDGDGLSDAAEFQLASLGFDFNANQAALVNVMFSNITGALPNLNTAGLYTTAQVQALHIGTPLIARNPATGQVKLTIGVKKATTLTNFLPFPLTSGVTVVNGAGELEFTFTPPDDAAFFRLESR